MRLEQDGPRHMSAALRGSSMPWVGSCSKYQSPGTFCSRPEALRGLGVVNGYRLHFW